jgi:hypothetical protein
MTNEELEKLPDEELVKYRTVVQCTEFEGGYDVTLSCGHRSYFAIAPAKNLFNFGPLGDGGLPCAQCVNILVDRKRGLKKL